MERACEDNRLLQCGNQNENPKIGRSLSQDCRMFWAQRTWSLPMMSWGRSLTSLFVFHAGGNEILAEAFNTLVSLVCHQQRPVQLVLFQARWVLFFYGRMPCFSVPFFGLAFCLVRKLLTCSREASWQWTDGEQFLDPDTHKFAGKYHEQDLILWNSWGPTWFGGTSRYVVWLLSDVRCLMCLKVSRAFPKGRVWSGVLYRGLQQMCLAYTCAGKAENVFRWSCDLWCTKILSALLNGTPK